MTEPIKEFSLDLFSLKGKTAIITGGNTNLGMGYAVAFAKAGADLFIPHFTGDIDEVKEKVEAEGRKVKFLRGDLSDKSYVREIVKSCISGYGKIDILINNAGVNHFEDFRTFPDEKFEQVVDINLNACYYLGNEVAKVMADNGGGKIINIGSVLSFTADVMCPGYAAAKHGVIGLTRYFANNVGKYNIQTNALCPGFIKTEINSDLSDNPEFYNKITNRIPAGRWGTPEDLVGTAVFLASRASDYLNGWAISVDGGFSTTL
ncbi:MAG: SDR family oxidoreductase [Oscillospiraceae bacterium]|nr:SDR family oxidoreductase [Oscillospiraceae bacterium]